MTRNDDFGDFLEDYVGVGCLIAIVLAIVGLFFSAIIYDSIVRDSAKSEKNLYIAIQGEATDDGSDIQEAAEIIKSMVLKEDELLSEHLTNLQKLSSLYYLDLFLKKNIEIIGLVQDKEQDLAASVEVPKWRTFWKWWGILSYLCLVVATTMNFVIKTFSSHESTLEWPWKSIWSYPVILVMSPVLLPVMIGESICRVFCGSLRVAFIGSNVQSARQSRLSALKEKKTKAVERIKNVNSGIEATKEAWLEHYINLDSRIKELRSQIQSNRGHLSSLGQQITSTQQSLAKSQSELTRRERNFETDKQKAVSDCLDDFDKLRNLPHVATVYITGNMLYIYTDTIYIDYELQRYEIGMFLIKINMESRSFSSLDNLCSTHRRGLDHPYGDGDFCWGTLSDSIKQALCEEEYVAVVHYMLQAFQSARGDAPWKVKEWKRVKKEKKKD